jgi:hypothetical protein
MSEGDDEMRARLAKRHEAERPLYDRLAGTARADIHKCPGCRAFASGSCVRRLDRTWHAECWVRELEARCIAVVEFWRPENAPSRSFGTWFQTVLPDLREALGYPRSMAEDETG